MIDRNDLPDRAVMGVPHLSIFRARYVATDAARIARGLAPKATVASASKFYPIFGEGWFGVSWEHHPYVFYQEMGIRPFTMRSLAGKTIPMWVNDPDGKERKKNPKAQTRRLADGRVQVLIFRRAAKSGQRKKSWKMVGGQMHQVTVPASYPGAPGRIAVNRSQGIIRRGDVDPSAPNPGQIAEHNVGVRWRHPGLNPKRFLAQGLVLAAVNNGFPVAEVQYLTRFDRQAQQSFSVLVHHST